MDIQYRRDMNHTYMVLESTDAAVLESYETRIILTNRIGGLLPCSLQYLDNRTCFCYDTTSRQSLATDLEGREITRREMQKILGSLLSVMSRMEEYLLSLRHLVLTPEQIFLVPDTLEVSLCFAPFHDAEAKEGLRKVAEFLLSHTGRDSQDAVILGSRFSHALRQPNIQLEDLERILYGELPGDDGYAGNAAISPESGNWTPEGGLNPNAQGLQYDLNGPQPGLGNAGAGPGPSASVLRGAGAGAGSSGTGPRGGGAGLGTGSRGGGAGLGTGLRGAGSGLGGTDLGTATKSQPDPARRNRRRSAEDGGFGTGNGERSVSPASGKQKTAFGGRRNENSSREPNGDTEHKNARRWKVNWYVAAVVAAGFILAAGVYVFLHYYNGGFPPWPFLAVAGVAVVAAVILVIIIRRKALKKSWPEGSQEEEAYSPFSTGKVPSPYQEAYGSAVGMNGADFIYGNAGVSSAYRNPEGLAGFTPAFGNGAEAKGAVPLRGSGAMPDGEKSVFGRDPDWNRAMSISEFLRGKDPVWGGPADGYEAGASEDQRRNGELAQEAGLTTILAPLKTEVPEAYLVPENGPEAGKEIRLTVRRTRIGKQAGHADICLDSPAVSRRHAEIICKEEAFFIRDMNSRNGTSVNDEMLTGNSEQPLQDGDRVRVADCVFIFRQPMEKGVKEPRQAMENGMKESRRKGMREPRRRMEKEAKEPQQHEEAAET